MFRDQPTMDCKGKKNKRQDSLSAVSTLSCKVIVVGSSETVKIIARQKVVVFLVQNETAHLRRQEGGMQERKEEERGSFVQKGRRKRKRKEKSRREMIHDSVNLKGDHPKKTNSQSRKDVGES